MRRYLNLSTGVLNYADVYRFSALEDRPWLEKVLENNRMLYCFVDPEAPDYLFFANEIRNINISDVRFSNCLLYTSASVILYENIRGNMHPFDLKCL